MGLGGEMSEMTAAMRPTRPAACGAEAISSSELAARSDLQPSLVRGEQNTEPDCAGCTRSQLRVWAGFAAETSGAVCGVSSNSVPWRFSLSRGPGGVRGVVLCECWLLVWMKGEADVVEAWG